MLTNATSKNWTTAATQDSNCQMQSFGTQAFCTTVRDWWLAIWHMMNDDHDDESRISQCYIVLFLYFD